jgi:exodeoxyribonuclease III
MVAEALKDKFPAEYY